jgi:hypothetical protein
MRGNLALGVGLLLVVLMASIGEAQTIVMGTDAEGVQLPVKGRIDARDGNTQLNFKVYNAARGGTVVYSESRQVAVKRGIYFAVVGGRGLPLAAGRSLWVQVSTATGRAVGGRQAFTAASSSDVGAATAQKGASTYCFTCGGEWPAFSGFFANDVINGVGERGSACVGRVEPTSDTLPFLCSQRIP